MALLVLGGLIFASCEADRDSNPVIDLSRSQDPRPQDPITLNSPAFASGTYDLATTDFLELTCSAPSYGYAATTYVVQLSVDEDMSEPSELTTTYSLNKMNVPGKEIAIATTKQLMSKKGTKQEEFPVEAPVYLRIRAYVNGVKGTETMSNIVKLNKVRTSFALPNVEVPNPFYVNGTYCENDWTKAMPTVPANGTPTTQWRIVWVDDKGIKVSPTKGEASYTEDMITVSYKATTPGFTAKDDGTVTASTPGWYLMIIDGVVDNDQRTMALSFRFDEAAIWLIGTSIVNPNAVDVNGDPAPITSDNCWSENLRDTHTPYVKFTIPTDMKGEFVSPELTSAVEGDGGTRVYVKVKTMEWWKSEFMVFDENIVYRGTGGDQERVNGTVGQKIHLNFLEDKGKLK